MGRPIRNRGSVLLMVVFIVALLATMVMGMLEINTEEIEVMQNQIYAAEALATAEAGLEDAVMSIRDESNWSTGIPGKLFNGGSYTVTRSGNTVDSTGITGRGYTAKVSADITTSGTSAPYKVKINTLRINE